MIPLRVQFERNQAMLDVSSIVNEYGEDVIFMARCEDSIVRDKYNSIKSASTEGEYVRYELKSYPVENNPTRQQMEKAGILQQCECIAWFAMKDIEDKGLTFDTINVERSMIIIDGHEYGMNSKAKVNPFADEHLYMTVGLFKK